MKYSFNKKLIFGSLLILILVLIFLGLKNRFGLGNTISDQEVIITLTEDGFVPTEVVIQKGQKVTFKTVRGKLFWPASDLHPTHLIYPEFDPQNPIGPDKTWSFKFDKVGQWRYHDHLFPYYQGVIKVIDGSKISKVEDCDSPLLSEDTNVKLQCAKQLITDKLQKEGLASALKTLGQFYNRDNFWTRNCHTLTHLIGEQAYLEFAKSGKVSISPEVAYCGYGFFHGFMEVLFAKGDGIQSARKLCQYMQDELIGKTGRVFVSCLHGIGHGLVDGSDKKAWGDAFALVEPGLQVCDKVGLDQKEGNRCYTGAFNSIFEAMVSGSWGLKVDKSNPTWLCQEVSEKYRLTCYSNAMAAVRQVVGKDFLEGVKFLEKIKEDKYALAGMETLSALVAKENISRDDFSDFVAVCRKAPERARDKCLTSFARSLVEFGKPEEEYVKAVKFCNTADFSAHERDICFPVVVTYSSLIYSTEKMNNLCKHFEEKYRKYCFPSKGL